jgi:hypothetical protein
MLICFNPLMNLAATCSPPGAGRNFSKSAQLSGFMQGLAQLGWTAGRNVRMDLRWAVGSVERTQSAIDLKEELQTLY